ncbi:MAG: DUF447 domain-containing protein, partial [Candidatus Hodarchaeota archaeon]
IYEALVTTINGEDPNFAAMGVIFDKGLLIMKPFVNTMTFENLQSGRECVLHFSRNLDLFALGAFKEVPHRIDLADTASLMVKSPTSRHPSVFAWLECTVTSLDAINDRGIIQLNPVYSKIQQTNSLFTRADSALMECIIHATRINLPSISPELRAFMKKLLLHYEGIIKRVASNTNYEKQLRYILQQVEKEETEKTKRSLPLT